MEGLIQNYWYNYFGFYDQHLGPDFDAIPQSTMKEILENNKDEIEGECLFSFTDERLIFKPCNLLGVDLNNLPSSTSVTEIGLEYISFNEVIINSEYAYRTSLEQFIMRQNNLPENFPINEYPLDLLEEISTWLCNGRLMPVEYNSGAYSSEVLEIENGISILSVVPTTDLCNIPGNKLIAYTEDRFPEPPLDEDLQHSFNAPGPGILLDMTPLSNEELYELLETLIGRVSTSPLEDIGMQFTQIMRTNSTTDTEISNIVVNGAIAAHPSTRNFLKRVGAVVENIIASNPSEGLDGAFSSEKILQDFRPKYGFTPDLINGLRILVNDTEKTESYYMPGTYSIDGSGNWEAQICLEIQDDFGLDLNDALRFQAITISDFLWGALPNWQISDDTIGFSAWWVLQHQRNQIPFRHRMRVIATIGGTI